MAKTDSTLDYETPTKVRWPWPFFVENAAFGLCFAGMALPFAYVIRTSPTLTTAGRLRMTMLILGIFGWWCWIFVYRSRGARRLAAITGGITGVALLLIAATAMTIGR